MKNVIAVTDIELPYSGIQQEEGDLHSALTGYHMSHNCNYVK